MLWHNFRFYDMMSMSIIQVINSNKFNEYID